MKKLFLLLTLSLVTSLCFSQKLKTNEIDEFTGSKVAVTTWENICFTGKDYVYAMVWRADGKINLHIKHMPSKGGIKEYKINQGDKFLLLLDDGTVVTSSAAETFHSSIGAGAVGYTGSAVEGIYAVYSITDEDAELLRSQPLKKVRMYTSVGYIELDLKETKKDIIQNMFTLVN